MYLIPRPSSWYTALILKILKLFIDNLMNFREWLINEESEKLEETIKERIRRYNVQNVEIPKIIHALNNRKLGKIEYIDYLLGFIQSKKILRDEDYLLALDTYQFYKRNKDKFVVIPKVEPFQLGRDYYDSIYEIKHKLTQPSKTQLRKVGKERVIKRQIGEWEFITIPRATNEQEEEQNKILYMNYGKGTNWCTAAPDCDYWKTYVNVLDITVIRKNNENLYQFGLSDGKLHYEYSQFMNNKDNIVEIIKQSLEKAIKNVPEFRNILNLPQFHLLKKDFLVQFNNPDGKIRELAIHEDGLALQYLDNPSKEIQRLAVKRNGYLIKYIENPSKEVQRLAIQQDGYAIQYIKNPSEELQKLALKVIRELNKVIGELNDK